MGSIELKHIRFKLNRLNFSRLNVSDGVREHVSDIWRRYIHVSDIWRRYINYCYHDDKYVYRIVVLKTVM